MPVNDLSIGKYILTSRAEARELRESRLKIAYGEIFDNRLDNFCGMRLRERS